jgi:DNA polymerase V
MLAHVDANNFYASCEQVFNPALRGKPVVVLSNNDGVIVSRSAEAKALGIDMARPFFEIQHLLRRHRVHILSSNYALYDDMSNRLTDIYRHFANQVEVYSIDECFLSLDNLGRNDLLNYGRDLRRTALQWTGIGVGVGIAASKTLAKLANHLAKRIPENAGVCALTDEEAIAAALRQVELTDLWGISGGFKRRLAALAIHTPWELRNADPYRIRDHLGVVGQRIVFELRGEPCLALEPIAPDKQNICCSRSFGEETRSFDEVREAICTFASQAAVKLRRQDLAAGAVSVFIGTNIHAPPHVEQYHNSYGIRLAMPSFDTREIARAAVYCLSQIHRPQHAYKKAGVMLHRLLKRSKAQPCLFDQRDHERDHRLMRTMDRINRDYSRGALRIGSAVAFELMPGRTVAWRGRCERRSPRYTTRWEELPLAEAQAL